MSAIATLSEPPRLAVWFATIISGVQRQLGRAAGRAPGPVLLRLYNRLGRLSNQFDALLTRLAAGWQPRPRPLRPLPDRSAARRSPPPEMPPRLPGKVGWGASLGWEVSSAACPLNTLLDDPEMQALLATSPQAVRIVRAYCRLFALPPPPYPPGTEPRRRRRPPPAPAPAEVAGPAPPLAPASKAARRTLAPRPWWLPPGAPWTLDDEPHRSIEADAKAAGEWFD